MLFRSRTTYAEISIPRILATRVLSKIWAGAYLGPTRLVHHSELPDPDLPNKHFVRVRNRFTTICGTDLHLVKAEGDPKIAPAALPSTSPLYLGHEICGEVVEVGEAVTQVHTGNRVALRWPFPNCLTQDITPPCRNCAQSEFRLCENQADTDKPFKKGGGWGDQFIAHEAFLYRPPEPLSDEEVALIEPAACCVHIVLRTLPKAGDKVMVLGCGTMGLFTIQALRALTTDVQVTAMARHEFQARAARSLGAHHVHTNEDGYDVTADTTGAKLYRGPMGSAILLGGFDAVYDCVGIGRTLTEALRWTRASGCVVLVGNEFEMLRVDLTPLWFQEKQLIAPVGHGREIWEGEEIETYELTSRLFQSGKLKSDGIITHRFPLPRWREAIMTALDKKKHQSIKVGFEFEK